MRIVYTTQFKKDYKKIKKQNLKLGKLKNVIEKLLTENVLEPEYKDHQLLGSFKGYCDCHIKPNWILIYKIIEDKLILERTGSHSELFKK